MRKVLVDCGVADGRSTEFFKQHLPQANEFEYFGFEPRPGLTDFADPRAVWVEDGTVDFYLADNHQGEGATLRRDKTTGHIGKQPLHKVECLDFSRWLMDNFTLQDHVVVKMNIEGAEYEVLEHLIDQGSIHLIDRLFVQWHVPKLRNISRERHDALIHAIPIPHYSWNLYHGNRLIEGKLLEKLLKVVREAPKPAPNVMKRRALHP